MIYLSMIFYTSFQASYVATSYNVCFYIVYNHPAFLSATDCDKTLQRPWEDRTENA